MLKKILRYIIQIIFLINNLVLMYYLRSSFNLDITKDLYSMISIIIIVLTLFISFDSVFRYVTVSLSTLFVSIYLSSQYNYFLENNTYYSFNFDDMFAYTSSTPIIIIVATFAVAVVAEIFIIVTSKEKYRINYSRLFCLGFIVLALLPIYLFKYDINRGIGGQKYNITEQPYYNYHHMDDVNKFVDDYGILNFLCRDLEIQNDNEKDKSESIQEITNYFKEKDNEKNKYTGVFKDKSIIIIESSALDLDKINETDTPLLNELVTNGISTDYYYTPHFYNENGDLDFMANTSFVPCGEDRNTIYDYDRNAFRITLPKTFGEEGYNTQYFFGDYKIYENRERLVLDVFGYNEFYDCTSLGGDADISSFEVCDKVAGMIGYFSSINEKYMALVNTHSKNDIYSLEEGLNIINDTIINCGQKENYVIVLMSLYDKDIKPVFTIYDCSDERVAGNELKDKPITCLDLIPTLYNMFGFNFKYTFGEDALNSDYNGFVFELTNNEKDAYWYNNLAVYSFRFRKIITVINEDKANVEKELECFKNKAETIRISHLVLDTNYFGVTN